MSELRERVLREGYAWYMRDDGITPDTPLTDALVALYEAVDDLTVAVIDVPGGSELLAARDHITELMGGSNAPSK